MSSAPAKHALKQPKVAAPVPADACDALRTVARTASGKQELYREALRVLGRHFDAPYAAIHVDSAAETLEDYVRHGNSADARWQSLCDGLLLDARYRRLPIARLYDSISLGHTFAAMAVPIVEDTDGVVGSVVVVAQCESKSTAGPRLSELQALVALTGTLASSIDRGDSARRASAPHDHAGVAKAGSHKTLHEFAFALANGLKSKLGCDQVSLGLVRGRGVKVVCMSGLDDLYPRSPGARLIQQAMEECLDAGRVIGYQNDSGALDEGCSTGHLLHQRWHHQTGNSSVVSLPLLVDGACVAVLSLRNSATSPFKNSDLAKIQEMVSPLVPGLLLMQRAHRNLGQHALDIAWTTATRWLGPGAWGRKAALVATVLFAAWLAFGSTPFTVTVPCEVVPGKVRQITAPFQGTIGAAQVKPGDSVAAGQVLVELDTKELVLERERILAESNIAELELSRALLARDHAAAAQAESRMEVAQSQLEVVDYRITRSKIRAPVTGVILSGDVIERVGEVVPLGEPLLQFAPHGHWAVELRAPEFAALYLETGQAGEFTTSARPDQAQPCKLVRVEMSSEVVNGKNVFVAEAEVDRSPPWIRFGMTGVARIHVGHRPVWWVGLHRTIDAVRLQLWKL